MICPECNSDNIVIQDDSFDYGASHCGPAGIQIVKYPVCQHCLYGKNDGEDDFPDEDIEVEE